MIFALLALTAVAVIEAQQDLLLDDLTILSSPSLKQRYRIINGDDYFQSYQGVKLLLGKR